MPSYQAPSTSRRFLLLTTGRASPSITCFDRSEAGSLGIDLRNLSPRNFDPTLTRHAIVRRAMDVIHRLTTVNKVRQRRVGGVKFALGGVVGIKHQRLRAGDPGVEVLVGEAPETDVSDTRV
jgi:hypothetical protein